MISTEVIIEASPSRVWAVLTDSDAYPRWNPFIRSMNGRLQEGETISIEVTPPGRSSMRFRPLVLVAKPEKELRWLGSLGIPGLFDGEHAFQLTQLALHQTLFRQSERFRGLLVPLIMRGRIAEATRKGFIAMNDALKQHAESAGP